MWCFMKKVSKNLFCLILLVLFVMAGASFTASALDGALGMVYRVHPANTPYGINISWNHVDGAENYYLYRRCGNGKAEYIARIADCEEPSYYDGDVVSGKIYYYSVKAVNSGAESSLSDEKRRTFTASPKINKVESKKGYLAVTWGKVTGADKYFVYRKTGKGEWEKIATTGKDKPYYNDENVKNNTVYRYAVVTKDGNNLSTMDDKGFKAEYMTAPKGFVLKNAYNKIYFSWNKVSGAAEYTVYRKDTVTKKWAKIGITKTNKFTDSNVKNGAQYYYTVRVTGNDGGFSTYNTSSKYTALFELKGVSVINKPAALRISWKKANVGTGYKIFRLENGEWKYIKKITNRNTTYYDDKSVKQGKTYTYMVRSYQGSALGSFKKSGVKAVYYSAPKLTLQYSPNGVRLDWTKSNVGKSYTIFYKGEGQKSWKEIAIVKNINKTSTVHKKPLYGKKNTYYIAVNGANTKAASYTQSIYGIDPNKKIVALTYDDGPYSPVTNRILNTLDKYNGRATFFVVGNRVNEYKSSVKRAVNMGCEIGNHTYSHTILTGVGTSTIKSQISKTNSVVKNLTGVAPKIVRTPGGAVNSMVRDTVNYPIINWSVDTLDWKYRKASSVTSKVKSQVRDGSIILMHDLYESTALATEQFVPWLVDNGYQIVTVSELMQLKGVDMIPGTVYFNAY